MDLDPLILTTFGSPPADIDLNSDQRFGNDVSVAVLLFIAALGVSLRLAARMVRKSGLKADDYAILIALVRGYPDIFMILAHQTLDLRLRRGWPQHSRYI